MDKPRESTSWMNDLTRLAFAWAAAAFVTLQKYLQRMCDFLKTLNSRARFFCWWVRTFVLFNLRVSNYTWSSASHCNVLYSILWIREIICFCGERRRFSKMWNSLHCCLYQFMHLCVVPSSFTHAIAHCTLGLESIEQMAHVIWEWFMAWKCFEIRPFLISHFMFPLSCLRIRVEMEYS